MLNRKAGEAVRDGVVPSSVGLERHSKEYRFYCGQKRILKLGIHCQLIMQMQMCVGCPNYFIYLDGGLKEILLVTFRVGELQCIGSQQNTLLVTVSKCLRDRPLFSMVFFSDYDEKGRRHIHDQD